jgi:hypothetical protein
MPYYVIDITSLSPDTRAYAVEHARSHNSMTPEEMDEYVKYLKFHDTITRIKRGECIQMNRATWFEEPSSNDDLTDTFHTRAKEGLGDAPDDSKDSEDDEPKRLRHKIHSVKTTDEGIDFENKGFWFGSMERCQSPEAQGGEEEEEEEEEADGVHTAANTTDNNTSIGSLDTMPVLVDEEVNGRREDIGPIEEPDKRTKRRRAFSKPAGHEEQQTHAIAALETSPRSDDAERSSKRPRLTIPRNLSSPTQDIGVRTGNTVRVSQERVSPTPPPSRRSSQDEWPVRYAVQHETYRGWE